MKGKVFPVSMAVLWGIVFSQAMHSVTLGVCMGLAMGPAFGLFDSGRGEKEDEERGRWSVAFPAEGYKFVTPWDLREKGQYRKIMEYSHKCSKCKGNMKIIPEKEFKKLKCPKCHKKLKVDGDVLWD